MREVAVADGTLAWDVLEITPPWLSDPSTVILHHGLGTSADMWSEWLPRLAMYHRVVRFDMRGCGRSSALKRGAKLDLELFRNDVLAVADASGARRFHLIGESFGGTVALFTGATCRERLLSITTISSPHRGARMRILEGWRELADGPESMRAWSERMMTYRFFDGAVSPEALNWFQALQDRTDPALVRGVAQLVRNMDLTLLLRDLDLPVLLVAPDSSPFVEAELVSELHGILPRSSLQVFAGTRHGLAFSHAAACADLFRTFSAALPSN
ncbi:MAG: alpha/beta fold hydrolase [Proteobacteria bacterium]|nr:alpha/beta fold hydrolase [Pseudomonadota bacterium]